MSRAFETEGPAGTLAGWVLDGPPSGDPVVLLHGVNCAADEWSDVARRLAASRTVVAFDFRGHGRSARGGPYTAAGYTADLGAVMDALHLERAHVAGTSFGGATALRFTAENPERVLSAATLGMPLKDAPEMFGQIEEGLNDMGVRAFFEHVVPRYDFGPDADPAIVATAVDVASDNDLDTVRAILRAGFTTDLEPVAAAVDRPVLVAVGERDLSCPIEAVEPLARILDSPLTVIPGASHSVHLEDPAATAELFERHLRAHDLT